MTRSMDQSACNKFTNELRPHHGCQGFFESVE
jgi:hypothetical protein